MRSSTGQHYPALDHVRALAILLVFCWHFLHGGLDGKPVAMEGAPAVVPLALFDEGHVGVALFMVLSGYLFARLLDNRRIKFRLFIWNRFVRLAPLLAAVLAIAWFQSTIVFSEFLALIAMGFVLPTWPNGGWSVAIEGQFYLLLPLLLCARRKWTFTPLAVVGVALVARAAIFAVNDGVQFAAYWTILGRIDQFVLGMAAFSFAHLLRRRHLTAALTGGAFMGFYWWFDRIGGYAGTADSALWVALPAIEGVAFATLLAYYDASFDMRQARLSRAIAKVGEYSYSIYLLHFFVVFKMAQWIDRHFFNLSNFYVALGAAVLSFVVIVPMAAVSYHFFESPLLRLRRRYVVGRDV